MSDPSPDVPLTSAPEDGQAFGHFVVPRRADGSLYKLGEGNMGVTYRAFDTSLRVEVALKVIRATRVNEEEARRRFQREARAAAKIRHPNVASVLYLGEEGGEFFYAMEFVPGSGLDALLQESAGPLLPVVAVAFAAQVAAALNAAHRREVVHRDLKPANLMLLDTEHIDQEDARTEAAGHRQIKVIDFGLARSFSAERQDESLVTQTVSGFIGTPTYASPEQAAGEGDIDGRSDLYSLGIILWQMLAGSLPFTGKVIEVMRKHLFAPPPMEQLPAGLPEYLLQILTGLLAKEPAQRWPQTAGELRNALDACLHDLENGGPALAGSAGDDLPTNVIWDRAADNTTPTVAGPLSGHGPVVTPPFQSGDTTVLPVARGPHERTSKKPILLAVGVLVLFAGLAVAGWHLAATRSRSGPLPSPIPAASSPPQVQPLTVKQTELAATPAPGSSPADPLAQGRALRQRGELHDALARLQEAETSAPNDPQIIAEIALTFEAMQSYEAALEQWQRIYEMGDSAGPMYQLAGARIHGAVPGATVFPSASPDSAAPAGGTVMKITSINSEETPDPSTEKKISLKIVIKAFPGSVIDPNKVRVETYFYDLLAGREIVQTNAQTDYAWLSSPPIDWANDKSEVLEALYLRPKIAPPAQPNFRAQRRDAGKPTPNAVVTQQVRIYLGYEVRLYYKGQLQDVQADPIRLLQQFPAPLTTPAK